MAAITELNAPKGRVVHPVEHGDRAYSEVADRIEEINRQTLGLAFEARLFRKEVNGYDFIMDEARIKANAPTRQLTWKAPRRRAPATC